MISYVRLVWSYNIWMDLQYNQIDRCKKVNDLQLGSQRFDHKFQGKDQHIYFERKQDLMGNQNLQHIQVDILHKDFLYNLQDMCMLQHHFALDTQHSNHMDWVNKVMKFLQDNFASIHIDWTDLQCNQ